MNDRTVVETVSRCVSCMVFYRNCVGGIPVKSSTASYKNVMSDEVFEISRLVTSWGLERSPRETILEPVKKELFVRYGEDEGATLFNLFERAFGDGKA